MTTRKYAWGKLSLSADFANASSPILYAIDGEELRATPFQVSDVRHRVENAFAAVNGWLKRQNPSRTLVAR